MPDRPTIPLQFGDFGNAMVQGAHARYYNIEGRAKADEERRKAAAAQYVAPAMAGDNAAMGQLAVNHPAAATAVATALSRMDADKRAQLKSSVPPVFAVTITGPTPAVRPASVLKTRSLTMAPLGLLSERPSRAIM